LDEIAPAWAFLAYRRYNGAGGVELVVARKDGANQLFLVVLHRDQIAAQDFKPRIFLPHMFPQVAGGIALRIWRVARGTVIAEIEGQKHGLETIELRGHAHFGVRNCEVNEGAAGEG